ncbi:MULTISPECIES: hypothetical protein [Amycolatopsis]|nr:MULTISPECIES: hypothetical protein [Amycolatopsis]
MGVVGYLGRTDDAAGPAQATGIPAFALIVGWMAWTAVPMFWPDV